MRSKNKIMFCLAGGLLLAIGVANAQDVEGSKDHPLISRFAGSVIKFYDVKEFDEYTLPLAKAVWDRDIEAYKFANSKRLEGKVTHIFYDAPKGRSTLEIFRSYESALRRAGFEILFSGAGEGELGQYFHDFIYRETHLGGGISVMGVDTEQQRYLAARLSRPEGEVYVSLFTSLHHLYYGWDEREDQPTVNLVVVEIRPMEVGLVTVGAMLEDLARAGRVAIYGIHFDFGKAEVRPESEPVLKEIAKLLQQNPELRLHVVGHTDNVGELDYNMNLSKARADAVVRELVSKHGVDANRLRAHGVGPLSPVASNKTEEGRAKNRRVELVEQ